VNVDPRIADALVQVVVMLIGLLAALIEIYGVKWLKSRVSNDHLKIARDIASVVVDAVEALAANGVIDYKGKFAEALRRVKDMAASRGIALTDEQWQSMIEAAVAAMKQIGGELKPKAA
jgi:hypothetical protein